MRAVVVARRLGLRSGVVDLHVAAGHGDLYLDVNDRLLGARRLDEVLGLIDAVRDGLDHRTAFALGFGIDDLHRLGDGVGAIALVELLQPTLGQTARRDLRPQVAHRRLRKADVVGYDPQQLGVRLAGLVDLELIELKTLGPRIARAERTEPGRQATDVDPVGAHRREAGQFSIQEERRVDDDVVEVLSGHGLMVGDHHVARLEAVQAIAVNAILDHDAHVGDEVRNTADVLRHQRAFGIEQRATVVAHLVDHHVVGRALQVLGHFV